jgi:hypothetical protein
MQSCIIHIYIKAHKLLPLIHKLLTHPNENPHNAPPQNQRQCKQEREFKEFHIYLLRVIITSLPQKVKPSVAR